MKSTIADCLILFVSSIITSLLIYYKIPVVTFQQVIVFLLLALLFLYNRIYTTKLFLFFSSMFVQLLIISTGSVFSPFLILLHLFTVATSFLINTTVALSFLVFTIATLTLSTIVNPTQLQLLKNDPGTVALYAVTLFVVVPLSQIIAKKYHLKEEISELLTKQVKVGGSIIESLNELVLVIDKNLKIAFVNEALKTTLNLSDPEILDKYVLDVLTLQDTDGNPASLSSLPLNQVLTQKVTRIVEGFLLYTKNRTTPFTVTIQIRPVIDAKGEAEQLILVITEGPGIKTATIKHEDLEKARLGQKLRLNHLKELLQKAGFTKVEAELELISKAERDLTIAQELEDHPIKENPVLTDLAEIVKAVLREKFNLAKNLNVELQLVFPPEEAARQAAIESLANSNLPPQALSPSNFEVPADPKWLSICLEKLLDMAILLSVGTPGASVQLTVQKIEKAFEIIITGFSPRINEPEKKLLFEEYYGELANKTNLRLGSGLEGFIVKVLTTKLSIPLRVTTRAKPALITFELIIGKKARS